jgi:hypothetical protein
VSDEISAFADAFAESLIDSIDALMVQASDSIPVSGGRLKVATVAALRFATMRASAVAAKMIDVDEEQWLEHARLTWKSLRIRELPVESARGIREPN